ncbi:MAG TPA: hypothetical protein VN903_29330 [Polyangia bacterium]|nr:hypothetical protein [Polyangia bacterium]
MNVTPGGSVPATVKSSASDGAATTTPPFRIPPRHESTAWVSVTHWA